MSEPKAIGHYVVIPMRIFLDEDLTPKARLLYGLIGNLSNQRGYCFATNAYLSELTGWHRDTISEFIIQLCSKNYLFREEIPTKSNLERRLFLGEGVKVDPPEGVRPNDLTGLGGVTLQNSIFNNKENTITESNDSVPKNSSENKPKKEKKEKVKKEKSPVFTACVKIWLEEIHPGWTFKGGMDGKALNGIIESMRHYSRNKNEREPTEEELVNFFRHLCGKLPEFYKLQTLSVINSKFDPIVEQIKKGGNAQLRGNSQVSIFSKYRHV